MQPDEQRYQEALDTPSQASGPVVTLSPEPEQAVETVFPVDGAGGAPQNPATMEPVRWQATEYVHRERDIAWYIVFGLVTVGLIGVALFVINSRSFAALIPVMAVALFVYTRRPPHVLDYTLSSHGLHINDQLFPFGEFKAFSLLQGFEQHSIILVPNKRFKPAITINFPEEAGEAIVDVLAARLPMREMEPDVVDRIIRRLHL